MLESLTAKNLELSERNAELQVAIDDFETEKELADELEEQQAAEVRRARARRAWDVAVARAVFARAR